MSENCELNANECLRGLRQSEHLIDNTITASAFIPKKETDSQRDPKVWEISINHYDEESAVTILREDKNNSKFGIVKFRSDIINSMCIIDKNLVPEYLQIERKKIKNNPFHGNITYDFRIPYQRVKLLAAFFATASELIP